MRSINDASHTWIFFFVSLFACVKSEAPADKSLEGQIFAVLDNGSSMKLGGISVNIFDRATVDSLIQERRSEATKSTAALRERLKEMELDKSRLQDRIRVAERALRDIQVAQVSLIRELPNGFADWEQRLNSAEANLQKLQAMLVESDQQTGDVRAAIDRSGDAGRLYDDLENPVSSALSDADGKFRVSVPNKGDYYLVAKFTRNFLGEQETLRWVLPVTAGGVRGPVLLSNSNVFAE